MTTFARDGWRARSTALMQHASGSTVARCCTPSAGTQCRAWTTAYSARPKVPGPSSPGVQTATRSPALSAVTSGPTSSTMPPNSWPTHISRAPATPPRTWRSDAQMPFSMTFTITLPAVSGGSATSRTSTTPGSGMTTALVVLTMVLPSVETRKGTRVAPGLGPPGTAGARRTGRASLRSAQRRGLLSAAPFRGVEGVDRLRDVLLVDRQRRRRAVAQERHELAHLTLAARRNARHHVEVLDVAFRTVARDDLGTEPRELLG